ncbi:hypothetical protein H9X87_11455 [Pseudoflavonifractor capillosus]|uniref:mediterrocin family bacteriocin n=1 Tax=Pseudoflavonifractor capillosus TaxID=106588 RepID=UPI00195804A5|nr:hypothetical protein [Pseudoflavonifractor capillosus]MBM6695366.1 hypothetical protein [Pseudoflavonifractor capillosus]
MKAKRKNLVAHSLVFAATLGLFASLACSNALAANTDAPTPRSHEFVSAYYDGSFDKAWEKVAYGNYGLKITYGFNTFLTDEDYVWGESKEYAHWSELYNGNGHHRGLIALPGFKSRVDVTHAGNSVSYYCSVN